MFPQVPDEVFPVTGATPVCVMTKRYMIQQVIRNCHAGYMFRINRSVL
jgi:hypothetical protein